MIDLFSSNELTFQNKASFQELEKEQRYKTLHEKPRSFLRALIQKLFLKILFTLSPKKFSSYKNKIRLIMKIGAHHSHLFLMSFYLRFRYPRYFILPSFQIYALHRVIEFLKILKPQKIDLFLVGGCLLGAVRQGSFAGRPQDIDLGIKEDQLPKLLESIPLLIRSGARSIRTRHFLKIDIINTGEQPTGKGIERLQIWYPSLLIDVEIYRKKNVEGKDMWGIGSGETMIKYNKSWIKKVEKDHVRNLDYITISLDKLMPIKVYGREFLAPPNPEIYLEKKFGKKWRIPNRKQFFWNKNKFKEMSTKNQKL